MTTKIKSLFLTIFFFHLAFHSLVPNFGIPRVFFVSTFQSSTLNFGIAKGFLFIHAPELGIVDMAIEIKLLFFYDLIFFPCLTFHSLVLRFEMSRT
jgi:hypothetical protein